MEDNTEFTEGEKRQKRDMETTLWDEAEDVYATTTDAGPGVAIERITQGLRFMLAGLQVRYAEVCELTKGRESELRNHVGGMVILAEKTLMLAEGGKP